MWRDTETRAPARRAMERGPAGEKGTGSALGLARASVPERVTVTVTVTAQVTEVVAVSAKEQVRESAQVPPRSVHPHRFRRRRMRRAWRQRSVRSTASA